MEETVTSPENVTLNGTSNFTGVNYKPPDDNVFTAITQSALGVLGFFGNLTVIIVFSTNKILRSKIINIYIINQVRFFSFKFSVPRVV